MVRGEHEVGAFACPAESFEPADFAVSEDEDEKPASQEEDCLEDIGPDDSSETAADGVDARHEG